MESSVVFPDAWRSVAIPDYASAVLPVRLPALSDGIDGQSMAWAATS